LYLHSSIVQTRQFERNAKGKREAIRFATIDSNIQLSLAFVINCLLLVLGAALFFGTSSELGRFTELYHALGNHEIVGAIASPLLGTLFAVALLASGQNSTITGTLSGQIVMEGFIRLRISAWKRRVITRLIAVVPVIICVVLYGGQENAVEQLLLYTQVFLSLQLPFAIIPLAIFTSSPRMMGEFVNRSWVKYAAWIIAVLLSLLNVFLIYGTFSGLG
jgi:manganese transport protein